MENASKALIIAGAILLAIAIIGIGMYVYQNAAGAMEGTDMTDQQVQTYNQTFTNYAGTQRGSNVKTMCNTIANHNRTAADDSEKVQVIYSDSDFSSETPDVDASEIDVNKTTTSSINTIRDTNVQSGVSYTINFAHDTTSGRITTVYINKINR